MRVGPLWAAGSCAALLLTTATLVGCASGPQAAPSTAPVSAPSASSAASTPTPSAGIPKLEKVSLQPEKAARVSIGQAGGQIELSDSAGNSYDIDIPASALPEDVEIVATPIAAINGLPDELAVVGGVHLEPEGLRLWSSAEVTITLAEPPGALAPIAYRADLDQPHRYPATVEGTSVVFEIAHFSGYALLGATDAATGAEELGLLIPFDPPAGPDDQALAAIAEVIDSPASPARQQAILAALRKWIDTGIRPMVTQFRALTTWELDGAYPEKSYGVTRSLRLWAYVEKLLVLSGAWPADADIAADIDSLVASAATHGIATTNTNCRTSPTGVLLVLRLPEELHWLDMAAGFEAQDNDPSLDEGVLEHLCTKVVYDANGGTDFPSGIQPGQTGTLNVRAGIRVDDVEDRFDAQPDVKVTPHGAEPGTVVIDRADSDGRFTREFLWAPLAPELRLDIETCLRGALSSVCQQAFVVRGSAPPTSPPAGACPLFRATIDGQTQTSTSPDGLAVNDAGGSANLSASGRVSMIVNSTFGGTVQAEVSATYVAQGGGTVTVVLYGHVRDDSGGMATVTLKVGDITKTFTSAVTGPPGADYGPGTLEIPITVGAGNQVHITVTAEVRSNEALGTYVTGGVNFLGDVQLQLPTCQ